MFIRIFTGEADNVIYENSLDYLYVKMKLFYYLFYFLSAIARPYMLLPKSSGKESVTLNYENVWC